MADVGAEFRRVQTAYEQPTLRLINEAELFHCGADHFPADVLYREADRADGPDARSSRHPPGRPATRRSARCPDR